MANDMSSAMSMLKGILGDGAEEKIASVMQSLSSGGGDGSAEVPKISETSQQGASGGFDENTLGYIMRMKGIIDEMNRTDDDRSRLLLSLRPYMREGRQKSIDSALKIMALTKISGVFGNL